MLNLTIFNICPPLSHIILIYYQTNMQTYFSMASSSLLLLMNFLFFFIRVSLPSRQPSIWIVKLLSEGFASSVSAAQYIIRLPLSQLLCSPWF